MNNRCLFMISTFTPLMTTGIAFCWNAKDGEERWSERLKRAGECLAGLG